MLFASLGTFGAFAINPKLIDQCSSAIGLNAEPKKSATHQPQIDESEFDELFIPRKKEPTPPRKPGPAANKPKKAAISTAPSQDIPVPPSPVAEQRSETPSPPSPFSDPSADPDVPYPIAVSPFIQEPPVDVARESRLTPSPTIPEQNSQEHAVEHVVEHSDPAVSVVPAIVPTVVPASLVSPFASSPTSSPAQNATPSSDFPPSPFAEPASSSPIEPASDVQEPFTVNMPSPPMDTSLPDTPLSHAEPIAGPETANSPVSGADTAPPNIYPVHPLMGYSEPEAGFARSGSLPPSSDPVRETLPVLQVLPPAVVDPAAREPESPLTGIPGGNPPPASDIVSPSPPATGPDPAVFSASTALASTATPEPFGMENGVSPLANPLPAWGTSAMAPPDSFSPAFPPLVPAEPAPGVASLAAAPILTTPLSTTPLLPTMPLSREPLQTETTTTPPGGLPAIGSVNVPPDSRMPINPSIVSEIIPCHGAEIVARVGTDSILLCDILPQAKRDVLGIYKERYNELSDAERPFLEAEKDEFIRQGMMARYPTLLGEQIQFALLYNDFVANKRKEEIEMHQKQFADMFDRDELSRLMKEFQTDDMIELKHRLKSEYGSTLERERLTYTRRMLAMSWGFAAIGRAEGDCSYDEMLEYYDQHKSEFEHKARVKWSELFVATANHPSEDAAWNKIAWMGNEIVKNGAPFEKIAREHSEGLTAKEGGIWDWMKRGDLASEHLENEIFTRPIGTLSQIIKSKGGFHIVRVVEREETHYTPFTEAQITIRNKIKQQRQDKYQQEYLDDLRKRFQVMVLKEEIQL